MKEVNKLIERYNVAGPRYTSYPAVPFWNGAPSQRKWIEDIKTTYTPEKGVDLYLHVPYCESLCYYCGCNRTITKNHDVEDVYVKLILKEWGLYKKELQFTPKINSIHFGGGTPTFLSPKNIDLLMSELLINKTKSFIGSIEIDPRTCSREHLAILKKNDISRISMGIQDFDPLVQKAINRDQSPRMIEELLQVTKEFGFSSINFDLIYGLPKQSIETIEQTIKIVAKLKPDLIAFYSYAHLPERIKNQKLINGKDLPFPKLKNELYETGKELLKKNGYKEIGMDHFALPDNFLYKAKKNSSLNRNFMGYVDKKSPILIGLGPTSISNSSLSFAQNAKDMKTYQEMISANTLAIEKGHIHNSQDLIIQEIILELMCQEKVCIKNLKESPFYDDINKDLRAFEKDGILNLENDFITILPLGKCFIRNVAMTFDSYLSKRNSEVKFSQTI